MRTGTHRARLLLFLFAIFAVSSGARIWSRRLQRERPFGRYNEALIRRHAAPVLFALSPQSDHLLVQAAPIMSRLHDGTQRHSWSLDCTDTTDRFIAHSVWDADTGRLIKLGCPILEQLSATSPILSRREAVRTADGWLRRLGMDDAAAGLHTSCQVVYHIHTWSHTIYVTWHTGAWKYDMKLDARTGQLVDFDNWSLRGVSTPSPASRGTRGSAG